MPSRTEKEFIIPDSPTNMTVVIYGTENQVVVTINADQTINISLPQDITSISDVTFNSVAMSALTSSRLMASDGSKKAVSVASLTSWIAGTSNQITVTDDTDGTITLSLPQDIASDSDVTFGTVTTDKISIDLNAGLTPAEGELTWNIEDGTINVGLPGGVVGQMFQELFFDGKNKTGSDIQDGTPIMFAAPVGVSGKVEIQPAIADGSINSELIMGMASEPILNGEFGKVTWFGKVRGIDTTGTPYGETWSIGDLIYVGLTSGSLTNVEPNAPNQRILIASVLVNHANNGVLLLRPTWNSKLKQLDDVNGTPLTTNGQLLFWDNSNGYFDFTVGSEIFWDDINKILVTDGVNVLSDTKKVKVGAGADASFYYDGADANIKTDEVAPSDLLLTFGANKTLELQSVVYEDLQVSISNVKVPTSNAPTDRFYNHGIAGGVTFPVLGFGVNEYVYFDVQTSHSMKLNTILDNHIHFMTPTDGSGTPDRFKFQLDVIAAGIGGSWSAPTGSPFSAEHIIASDYSNKHKLLEIADIPSSNTTVSSIYKFKLTRIAATQDEYSGEVYIEFTDCHYQKNTMGSRQEGSK